MSHLSDEQIVKLKLNKVDTNTKIDFITHLGICDFCENRFIEACEEKTVKLSKSVKEKLISKAGGMTLVKRKKVEFRNYCIKVALCATCAVAMIMTFNFSVVNKVKTSEATRQEPAIVRFSDMMNDIKDFFTFKEDINK